MKAITMLAAIQQSGWQHPPEDEDDQGFWFASFKFKEERDAFWEEIRKRMPGYPVACDMEF